MAHGFELESMVASVLELIENTMPVLELQLMVAPFQAVAENIIAVRIRGRHWSSLLGAKKQRNRQVLREGSIKSNG